MHFRLNILKALVVSCFSSSLSVGIFASAETPTSPDFNQHIATILINRCLECHQERDPSGNLDLSSLKGVLKGGDDGPAIALDEPLKSHLLNRIEAGEMPPKLKGVPQRLPDTEIDLLRTWIQSGAKWPENRRLDLYELTSDIRGGRDWWSLQPVQKPVPPTVQHTDLVSNPIDNFILAKLENANMKPAPLAERRQLIRRVYYDVIGLAPSYEQIEAFVADESDTAWESVVDSLLASPHFGEKWARHWLDLVRFAETAGYERDQEKPFAWRYRDWVVNAFNDDMPYDQFVVQQMAGDEIPHSTESTTIGTGLLRLGTWNDEPNDPQDYKYERLEDLVHVTSSAFLGLSVKCARCHDHKFDPIPQTDYYRMAAIFWPGAIEPRSSAHNGGPTPQELGYESVLGWTDLNASPKPLHLLKQGERHKPGEVVEAGVLTAIPSLLKAFEAPPTNAKSTTRRLQYAQWMTNPKHPLTPRVLVNRIWQHHFGQGLVRTPNNFGYRGAPPTHPQLLDWLASDLIQGDWKMKWLHKKILMSRTYRQSTTHPDYAAYQDKDAANHHIWHAERRRLDAEALRDSMLHITGELDYTMGGPSFRSTMNPDALKGLSRKDAAWQASPSKQQLRRSLYMYSKRGLLLPMMTTFNFSDTISPCGQRDVTTAPTQALALMNNSFTHSRSTALAQRVKESANATPNDRVRMAWQFALGRTPKPSEIALALNHLSEQQTRFKDSASGNSPEDLALASLCHVLINSNEFIYVD